MNKYFTIFFVSLGLLSFSFDVGATLPDNMEETVKSPPSHAVFDGLLQRYVSDEGKVDYDGIKENIGLLDDYLTEVKGCAPDATWTEAEKLTYWMNVYNAFTIKLIVDNYPVASIKDLHEGNPWDVEWIEIGGITMSLNDIEHNTIRKYFDEPRIHFAVNCAAISCPPLWNHAYSSERVYEELEKRTSLFFKNKGYNTITESSASISKILDWYGQDFGDVAKYITKYSVFNGSGKLTFKDYNWALNKK